MLVTNVELFELDLIMEAATFPEICQLSPKIKFCLRACYLYTN